MDLIGLPGNNPETGSWLEQLASRLVLGQTSTQIRRYRHWDEPGKPDIQYEASRLRILPGDVVVAKSLGTLILLAHSDRPDQAGAAGGARPAGAVFIGIPHLQLAMSTRKRLETFATNNRSLFIQQTADFTGGFSGLQTLLAVAPLATLVEVAGDDHLYADTEALADRIASWWQTIA